MPKYTVMKPNESFKHKGYVEWVQDFSTWFYSPYPDRNNDGDVVFLKGMKLTEGSHADEEVVMVGNDALEIFADQRVLVPVIKANYVAENSETSEWLYGMVRSHIRSGDNPPDKAQLRINGNPIDDSDKTNDDLKIYDVETSVFTISIPDAPVGVSLKHQIENPIQSSGFLPSVTRGYFVMLEFEEGDYYIESYATGAPTVYGQYHSSMLYHIIVKKSRQQKQLNIPLLRLNNSIATKVFDKFNKGELGDVEFGEINDCLDTSRAKIKAGAWH